MISKKLSDQSPKVISLGCRLNTYESEIMRSHAHSAGLTNALIVNTCAVTKQAEQQGKQVLRRLRRKTTLRRVWRTLHVNQDGIALNLFLDRVDNFHGRPVLM